MLRVLCYTKILAVYAVYRKGVAYTSAEGAVAPCSIEALASAVLYFRYHERGRVSALAVVRRLPGARHISAAAGAAEGGEAARD